MNLTYLFAEKTGIDVFYCGGENEMKNLTLAKAVRAFAAMTLALGVSACASGLTCVEATNSGSFNSCQDAGGFDSTCAIAQCPVGYTLTGGGGACSAGNRSIKGLSPNVSTGEFGIMCEEQGVAPQVDAICCQTTQNQ